MPYGSILPTTLITLIEAMRLVCAISGETWSEGLSEKPQNYVVLPEQPWLDGYNDSKGSVRQFVAAPLGKDLTVEGQLTGKEEVGGIQIQAFHLKKKYYEKLISRRIKEAKAAKEAEKAAARAVNRCEENIMFSSGGPSYDSCEPSIDLEMGLAAGGRIQQEIYNDRYGLECWDTNNAQRCFITLANATQWMKITGEEPPISPMNAMEYTRAGGVWFDYYDDDNKAIKGAKKLGKIKSAGELSKKKRSDWPLGVGSSFKGKIVKPKVVKIPTPLQKAQRGISDGSWW